MLKRSNALHAHTLTTACIRDSRSIASTDPRRSRPQTPLPPRLLQVRKVRVGQLAWPAGPGAAKRRTGQLQCCTCRALSALQLAAGVQAGKRWCAAAKSTVDTGTASQADSPSSVGNAFAGGAEPELAAAPGSRQAKTMPNNSNYRGLAQGSPLALNPLGTTCSSALFHAGSTD